MQSETETWTEQLISGKLVSKAVGAVGSWLGSKDKAAEAAQSTTSDPQSHAERSSAPPDAEPPGNSVEIS